MLVHCQGSDKASRWLNKVHYHRCSKKFKPEFISAFWILFLAIKKTGIKCASWFTCGQQHALDNEVYLRVYFWTLVDSRPGKHFEYVNLYKNILIKIPSSFVTSSSFVHAINCFVHRNSCRSYVFQHRCVSARAYAINNGINCLTDLDLRLIRRNRRREEDGEARERD